MVRTQVYLTEAQHAALRQAARREGISMTALLRRLVDQQIAGPMRASAVAKEAFMSLAGIGDSGRSDTSERHDEALDEWYRKSNVR